MGRSKKRKRTAGEQQHVDAGFLPLLYPASRLCTLHDLLLSLLLPSLQHQHSSSSSRPASEQPAPQTASEGAHSQEVPNKVAGQTMRADMDFLQAPMVTNVGMRQAASTAYMGVPIVAKDNVNICVQQVAIAADMGANMDTQHTFMPVNLGAGVGSPQATLAVDVDAQQVQASKVAMYIDAGKAVPTMPLGDLVAKETTLGADLSKQQALSITAAVDKAAVTATAHSLLVREGDMADYLQLLSHGYGVLPDTAPPLGHTMLEQRWTHQQANS